MIVKRERILTIVVLLITTAVLVYTTIVDTGHSKFGYIRAETVFNDFKMTKELKKKFEKVQGARENLLDSLAVKLRLAAAMKFEKEMMAAMQNDYMVKRQTFDQQTQELTAQYDRQIWTRINRYAEVYCKEHGYEMLFSLNNTGSVMYGSEKQDITEEFVAYINQQYEGGVE